MMLAPVQFKIRGDSAPRSRFLLGAASVTIVLLLWWLLTAGESVETRYLSPQILPNPVEVLQSSGSLYTERNLTTSIAYSFFRTTVGFLIAALIAVPLGILMASFTSVRDFFRPLSTIGGYIPIAVLVPLTLSWFGLGEKQKILFLAIATFVMLLPLIVNAIDQVDDVYLQTAYTLGATPWQTVFYVLVPVALVGIYDYLCLTYGIGWGYIILAEVIDARFGLGSLIITSQRRGPYEHVYAVLIVIILISILINNALAYVGKWLFPYRE
ncbi:MAG: ABC transporter permease subunit [Elusimicrobia bacterium]|nr:ABC transporter permease subunit [Elusimicrobiota bacterium]